MSKGYRDGAFALGLVVGGGIVLNLFLWLDYRSRNKVERQPSESQNAEYSEVGTYWDGLVGTFISPSDTLAQWVMAFFTIAATGVLILTLRSANKTNVAAIKASEAANTANEIMLNEQRPWLQVEVAASATPTNDGIYIKFDTYARNFGARPAIKAVLGRQVRDDVTGEYAPDHTEKWAEAFMQSPEFLPERLMVFPNSREAFWSRYLQFPLVDAVETKGIYCLVVYDDPATRSTHLTAIFCLVKVQTSRSDLKNLSDRDRASQISVSVSTHGRHAI